MAKAAPRLPKAEYVEKVIGWIIDASDRLYPGVAVTAREKSTLDGVYEGKSARLHRLVRLAYLRGCRRGATCAWEAQQPIVMRLQEASSSQDEEVGGSGS